MDMLERLALEVQCPVCRALPHEPCVLPPWGLHAGEPTTTHPQRAPREATPRSAPPHGGEHAERTCQQNHAEKRTYKSRARAERVIETIRKRGERWDHKPIRAYRCDSCGGWCITSSPA